MRIILALLLWSIICLGPSVKLYQSNGTDPAIFSDWDEAYYLPLLREGAEVGLNELFEFSNGRLRLLPTIVSVLPYRMVDVVVGHIWAFSVVGEIF